MKKLVVTAAVFAGLVVPVGPAAAESFTEPAAPVPSATQINLAQDVFCAVIMFLKGGWAGRVTDCTF
ncbi:hypothetical protein [Nocardia paucivorans]|uniref:hypothetical protein n=1 Tax=Nocardia paucivorans TaxID=114259 RepID=UPI0005938CA2|nr:hypothetical protein [Nocardia paucivorans]